MPAPPITASAARAYRFRLRRNGRRSRSRPAARPIGGALPGAIDWSNGAPIMICTGRPEYVTSFPNCGDPKNLSQAFPLDYERPTFAIGVAWPNAKDYRYEMQSVPIVDGSDGTCAPY